MTLCTECRRKIDTLTTRQRKVNDALHQIGLSYYRMMPWELIRATLELKGFNLDLSLLTDGVNRLHEPVGEGKWLTCSWHRMPSGRYEVVAYVN